MELPALKPLLSRAWTALINHINEPLPSLRELWWRLVTAIMLMGASFVLAMLSIGLWWAVEQLIGRAFYISDLVLLLTLVPSTFGMALGGFVALHSRKFNIWIWEILTSRTLLVLLAGGGLILAYG